MPSRRWWQLATAYAIALVLIAFWPTHVDQDFRFLHGMSYDVLEFVANIVLFIPFGVLAYHFMGNIRAVTALGVALSSLIEIGQWAFLPGRTASLVDVLSNGLGALVGAALMWRAAHPRRDSA